MKSLHTILLPFLFLLISEELSAQMTWNTMDKTFYPDCREFKNPEKFDSFVDSVIKNCAVFSAYDADGNPMDSIYKNAEKNIFNYVGLGPPEDLYTDSVMRASFNFYKYPLSKKGRELIFIYMNFKGPFIDQVQNYNAVYQRHGADFKNEFHFRGNIAGYFKDSSFVMRAWSNCVFSIHTYYHLKQSAKENKLDTLDQFVVYYPIFDMTSLPVKSKKVKKEIQLEKGRKLYTLPSDDTLTKCYPMQIAEVNQENMKAAVIAQTTVSGIKWLGIIIDTPEFLDFKITDTHYPADEIQTNARQLLWIKE